MMAIDPICGKSVDPDAAAKAGLTSTYGGGTFCFCSGGCLEEFLQLPALYTLYISSGEGDVHGTAASREG